MVGREPQSLVLRVGGDGGSVWSFLWFRQCSYLVCGQIRL